MESRKLKKFIRISIPFLFTAILAFLTSVFVVFIDFGSGYISNWDFLHTFVYLLCIFILLPSLWVFIAVWLGRKLSKSDKKIPDSSYFLAIIATPLACGIIYFTSLGVSIYGSDTFPYPKPIPGATIEKTWRDIGHGKYGTITYQYEINQSISVVEAHYFSEMLTYCSPDWQFEDTDILCDDYLTCRIAECEIPRKFVPEAQTFRVLLQPSSQSETHVIYWETTLNGIFQ